MIKKRLLLGGLAFFSVGLFARYDVVSSSSEFKSALHDYDYTFACFADEHSQQGRHIKDKMQALSLKSDFGGDLRDRFSFVFVPAQKHKLSFLSRKYGYQGKPLFLLFEFDQLVVASDLGQDYSIERMENFITEAIADSLKELLEDVKDQKEAARRSEKFQPKPRFHVGFSTGYYPGYGYYRYGKPYWWHRRYSRFPYRGARAAYHHRPGFSVGFGV